MSELYIRDLKESMREDRKAHLIKKRPDLKQLIEDEEDVVIGEFYKDEDCHF